jgi:hypothetical protein
LSLDNSTFICLCVLCNFAKIGTSAAGNGLSVFYLCHHEVNFSMWLTS